MVRENIFKQFKNRRHDLVKDRTVLQSSYHPQDLLHREEQIQLIAEYIDCALRGERPSNLLCIGKTGTGKTATIGFIGSQLKEMDPKMENCQFMHINCAIADSPYTIVSELSDSIISEPSERIPQTGLGLDTVISNLTDYMERCRRIFIIALDEIDMASTKNGNSILYYLLSMNDGLKDSGISVIGITNNTKFPETLNAKVHSRLNEVKIIFPPYGPSEITDILTARAELAFDKDVLAEGVIPYIAALTSKNGGDARVAIEMLRMSADIAERNGDPSVSEAHVRSAKDIMELDAVAETIKTLNLQSKIVLMSVLKNSEEGMNLMTTGEVYSKYCRICEAVAISPVTQRRVGDLISELDMLGLIYARTRSFGRSGRTKEIELSVSRNSLEMLESDPLFDNLSEYRSPKQTRLI